MRARRIVAGALATMTLMCAHRPKPSPSTVLFLCPHGGAKSLIAATYFNELATERQLSVTATAAASEDPYPEVPPVVVDLLRSDGVDVSGFRPRSVAANDMENASRVVTIGCDAHTLPKASAAIEPWNDVPNLSDDLPGSVAAIRRHVAALVEELAAGR